MGLNISLSYSDILSLSCPLLSSYVLISSTAAWSCWFLKNECTISSSFTSTSWENAESSRSGKALFVLQLTDDDGGCGEGSTFVEIKFVVEEASATEAFLTGL